jgi:transposase
MGRQTLLDDVTAQRIVEAVKLGAPWYLAAQAGGVAASTLRQWKAKGAAGEEPYVAFLARLKSAEAEGAAEALRIVREAARSGTWQAAAWLLERRYPKSFGLKNRVPAERPPTDDEVRELVAKIRGEVAS